VPEQFVITSCQSVRTKLER